MELARPGAELLFELFDGLGFEYTDVDEFPNDWQMRLIEPPISVRELLLDDPINEFSISRVNVSMALVAGLGNDTAHSFDAGGRATLNFNLLSVDDGDDSVQLSDFVDDVVGVFFTDFFFRLGGAIGPLDVTLSVVLEWPNFVLAITSGSMKWKVT